MTSLAPGPRPGRTAAGVRAQWRQLGGVGRLALAGVGLSLALAVALGFSITRAVERHVIETRMELLSAVVADLAWRGLVPDAQTAPEALTWLDQEAKLRLLGGETVRVKVWAPDGTIVYSDAHELIGQRFELGPAGRRALAGEAAYKYVIPSKPENVHEADMGRLLEFYLPVHGSEGTVVGLFEVYQQPDALEAALGRIRRNVWLSIGSGLGVLGVFMLALTTTNARELDRRRRDAEQLLSALLRAQDEERRRVVGALHDDVGQPLYRLLYGLQGSRARLDPDHPLAEELATLEQLVGEIDTTLHGELRQLHQGLLDRVNLPSALRELAATVESETDLTVRMDLALVHQPPPLVHAALFRAAQEALVNVRKHADASTVAVRLRETDGRVMLDVEDDGHGVDGPEGLGIVTTRERLAAVGGGLTLEARNGRGTRLRAWVPAGAGHGDGLR